LALSEVEDAYPLSPLQQGMWFDSLHAPQSTVNVEQLLGRLREVVDVEAFRAAWARVVARHPLLRTRFVPRDGEPRQEVLRHVRVPWQTFDWRGLSSRERRRRRDDFLREDRRRGFDMTAAPLFRLTLVREKDDRSWFCWTSHHLIG